ncbi:hypothetical protein BS78_02G257200 [Paspalum vaginatum]|nr:hypothetical protein BS78_02G257200 [Paspalum vaginatum]
MMAFSSHHYWTEEELKSLDHDYGSEKHDEHLKYMAAHGGIITIEDVAVSEAVKQKDKEIAARAKARRQLNNS